MVMIIYNPIITLVAISFVVSLLSNIVMKYAVDKHKMESIKHRMDKIRKKIKDEKIKNNPEEFKKILGEQHSLMYEQMRISFKAMIINLIFLIPFYYYLKISIGNISFNLPFELALIGDALPWWVLYIYYSILFTIIVKKLLKLSY